MKIVLLLLFSLSLFAKNSGDFFIKIKDYSGTVNSLLKERLTNDSSYNFIFYKSTEGLTGNRYYKYKYKYKNIDVEHKTIVVNMDKSNNFISLSGSFVKPNISNITPKLKSEEVFNNFSKSISKIRFHGKKKLVILIKDDKTYLAYKALVEYFDNSGHYLGMLYLDANSSKKIDFITSIQDALERKTYDFHDRCFEEWEDYYAMPGVCEANHPDNPDGTYRCSGTFLFGEGNSNNTDIDALNAYNNSGITYSFYKNMFNRDSFDNFGISLVSTLHVEFYDDGYGCHGYNAAFMGAPFNQMVYGDADPNNPNDNYSRALDVVAHELTHAVTGNESGLIYQDESGAINEALSDIFGASTEAWSNSGGTTNSNPNNFVTTNLTWQIGEDLGTPIRYMNNPTLDNRSYDYYPNRYTGDEDHGGVHLNSGIMNLAFYLLVSGGAHPTQNHGIVVNGIGIEKAIRIYYEAATNLFVENTTFEMARGYLAQAAETLYGNCSNEYEQVHLSFDSVGVLGGRDNHCVGQYNDACTTNDQCNELCLQDSEGNGYCTKSCTLDSECEVDNENLICVHYDTNEAYCVKVAPECNDLNRDNTAYESCSTDCVSADCQEGLICIDEVCTPSCSGYDDNSCADGYSCYNWNTVENPMFKCLKTRDYCEDESECGDNSCYYLYATQVDNKDALQAVCKEPLGERRDGESCVRDSEVASESCRTGFCFGRDNDFKCSEICNSSTDCNGEGRVCLVFQWYDSYAGKLPVCVKDDLIWTSVRFKGMCNQENGCPDNSVCLFNQIRTVIDSSDDLEYVCYSGLQAGKSYGESCSGWDECEGRECVDGKCTSFCDGNQNCTTANTHCESLVNYYMDRDDVKVNICVDGAPYDCSSDINSKPNSTNDGCICKKDYILENGSCINHKMVGCIDMAPEVAISNIVNVEITYNSIDGWSTPTNCEWSCKENSTLINDNCSCNENFVLINNSCINLCENNRCNEWESCSFADGSCNLLENRCNSNSDCEGNYICNIQHHCVDLCYNNSCNEWESCSLTDGSCNLLENRCNINSDCEENYTCNNQHNCIDLCENNSCNEWESCNYLDGSCNLSENRCNSNSDCSDNYICNNQHNCIDLCESNSCNEWESCNYLDGSCNLLENRCNSNNDCEDNYTCNDQHNCIDLCENNSCNEWESCNYLDGSCNLLENRCNNNSDCEDGYSCNTENSCIKLKEEYKGSSLIGCNYSNNESSYSFILIFFLFFIRFYFRKEQK